MTALQLEPSAHAPWIKTTAVSDLLDSIFVFLSISSHDDPIHRPRTHVAGRDHNQTDVAGFSLERSAARVVVRRHRSGHDSYEVDRRHLRYRWWRQTFSE